MTRPLRLSLAVVLVAVAACEPSPVAPPTDAPELVCLNAITPPTFRTLSVTGDTIQWTNRYAVPHHYADTVVVGGSGPPVTIISTHGGRCTTLADSLILYSPSKPFSDAP
jgi:hypothetical protein